MHPALLIIDLQRWFLEVGPPEKLARVRGLLAQTAELAAAFHARGLPVVHVLTIHQADGSTWNQWMREHRTGRLLDGSREAEEHPDVPHHVADLTVRKTRHSAFIRTDLEARLRARGVDTLVLAGFSTNACVGLTAIEAWERDFRVILAGEAILGTNEAEGQAMLDYLRVRFELTLQANAAIVAALPAHE